MSDEYHLERRVVLKPAARREDEWALQEIGVDGRQIGPNYLPWQFGGWFLATELTLHDSLDIGPNAVYEREFISGKLRADDTHVGPLTRYSLIGTSTFFTEFSFNVFPLPDDETEERCEAMGMRDGEVFFVLYVKAETYKRFAGKIASGQVTRASLRLNKVDGFYSAWSADAYTDEVKILLDVKTQIVEIPGGCEIMPPRLRRVGEVGFQLSSSVALKSDTSVLDEIDPPEDRPAQMAKHLSSIKMAVWIILGIVAGIAIKRYF